MGISYIVESVTDGGVGVSIAHPTEFGPDDRPPGLLRSLGLKEKEQHTDPERSHAALGEQILALYDEWRPQLYRYIRSLALNRDQTEEVIQETFMRLTRQLLQEDKIANVQGWIVRVSHNLAVDLLRRNDRDSPDTFDPTFVLENHVDPKPNPEEAYSRKEQIMRMMIALSKFGPRHRQCFQMRAQGIHYKDIGLALGISEQRAALIVKQVAVRLAVACG